MKAVAVLGGGSLVQLIAHADSGINGPADLKGKTVTALSLQDTTYYALLGMMANAGLSRKDVNVQGAGPAGVWKLFIAGKADAMAGVPDWIGIAQAAGKEVKIFPADKYFKSMAQAILASDKVIKNNPLLIERLGPGHTQGHERHHGRPRSGSAGLCRACKEECQKAEIHHQRLQAL